MKFPSLPLPQDFLSLSEILLVLGADTAAHYFPISMRRLSDTSEGTLKGAVVLCHRECLRHIGSFYWRVIHTWTAEWALKIALTEPLAFSPHVGSWKVEKVIENHLWSTFALEQKMNSCNSEVGKNAKLLRNDSEKLLEVTFSKLL